MTPSDRHPAGRPLIIAVTGGIGSGKSVVCRILSSLGYPVYDCDKRAKAIMDASDRIKSIICDKITPQGVNPDGSLNRAAIAGVVFNDPASLAILDSTVHDEVTADIKAWRASYAKTASDDLSDAPGPGLLFVETAIPFKSGLYRFVDDIWEVTAPEEIRVARASARDNVPPEAIRKRIAAQASESPSSAAKADPASVPGFRTILNDGSTPILPAILRLLSEYDHT